MVTFFLLHLEQFSLKNLSSELPNELAIPSHCSTQQLLPNSPQPPHLSLSTAPPSLYPMGAALIAKLYTSVYFQGLTHSCNT